MSEKIIFGPVMSRRLGRSLGIDLVPHKTCTLDCIYCECGKTTNKTIERKNFISPELILSELEKALNKDLKIDVITFSGSGEPTLYKDLEYLIDEIKKMTSIPLVMITNSTLLFDKEVRNALLKVDYVLPSLDASCFSTFNRINRPHENISFKDVLDGLIVFSKNFNGKIWLEILFCKGINDSEEELKGFEKIIPKIRTDLIQINSVDRPPAYPEAGKLTYYELERIAKRLGGVVIARNNSKYPISEKSKDVDFDESRILELLKRRPETIDAIEKGLSIQRVYLIKLINELMDEGKIIKKRFEGNDFFCLNKDSDT